MKQQIDVKARIVLIVWNLMLTVAVIAMSFRLAAVGARAEAILQEQTVLLEQMVKTDEALATLNERQSVLISDLFDYVDTLQKLGIVTGDALMRLDKSNTNAIAEIYQGHIIPLRAFHMENFNDGK